MDNYTITITNTTMQVDSPQAMNVVDLTNIFGGILIECVRSLKIPEDQCAVVRRELFDDMNLIFSRVLEEAFPEFELRPDITEQAIMEIENAIIERKMTEMAEADSKVITLPVQPSPAE